MDQTDRHMLSILCSNPRTTFKDLAMQLHLSIPAVQHRFAKMKEHHLITGFHTLINLDVLGGIRIMVFGRSSGNLDDALLKKIADYGYVPYAWCGCLNNIYLTGVLHDISEMDGFIRFAQAECELIGPEVLIIGNGSIIAQCPPTSEKPRTEDISLLSDLDYRIIRSMHFDARKQVADIANDVGVSTKTVRRHLDRMIDANLLDLVTRGKSRGQKVIDFAVFVKVKSPEHRVDIIKMMRNDPQYRLLNSWTLSNAPNMLYFEVQTETVGEMESIVTGLRSSPVVDSVMTDINMEEHIFSTWRDQMIEVPKKR